MTQNQKGTFSILYETFDDLETIHLLLRTSIESIQENIDKIKHGIYEKNIAKVYTGCHTLHGLGFIGTHKSLQIADIITELLRDQTDFNYIQNNTNNIIHLLEELYEQSDIFIAEINNELQMKK